MNGTQRTRILTRGFYVFDNFKDTMDEFINPLKLLMWKETLVLQQIGEVGVVSGKSFRTPIPPDL